MKKINLFALSLLTLSTAGVLASCANQKPLPQKSDVYFHAKAAVIDGETITPVDYKDEECATVTVKDKENLKYGEQDVEITIEPKDFFTFRKYNENWEATSAPVRPYVGLGSPTSLYNYRLDEGVAWEFEDQSEPTSIEGFYKEKYKITVKKEFFQKNIVIDYGNAPGISNNLFVYSSTRYNQIFKDELTLGGDFGGLNSIYKYYSGKSDLTAAGKYAVITYGFKNGSLPFSFSGWDNPPVKPGPKDKLNADTKVEYTHFKVYGYTKKGDDTTRKNIATYDTSIEKMADQDFYPTVSENSKYLTFHIKWDLLAEGKDKGYALKYEDIKVELGKPEEAVSVNINVAEGIKTYPADLFQHYYLNNEDRTKPYLTDGTLQTYDIYDGSNTPLDFAHVLANSPELKPGENIQYSTLFEIPSEEKDYFSVEIGSKTIKVDLVNKAPDDYTNYRLNNDGTPIITGDYASPVWKTNDNKWFLVQLNSKDINTKNNRTYGVPTKFQGKENLYYLYTTDPSALPGKDGSMDINIHPNEAPTFVDFELDSSSTAFGDLVETRYEVDGKSISVKFMPKDLASNYTVTYTNTSVTDYYDVTYIPTSSKYTPATILVRTTGDNYFTADDKFTLTLAPGPICVFEDGQTSVLGEFCEESGQPIGSDVYNPTDGQITKNGVFFYYRFRDQYAQRIFGKEMSKNLVYEASYNGAPCGIEVNWPSPAMPVVKITLTIKDEIAKGSAFSLKLSFIDVVPASPQITIASQGKPFGSYVGTKENIEFDVVTQSPIKEFMVNSEGSPIDYEHCVYQIDESTHLKAHVSIAFGTESTGILNGTLIYLNYAS